MIGRLCAGPKGGGSAGGLSEYLIGYAVAGKGSSKEEIAEALDGVYLEAERRTDLGVGALWSPEAGHGTRPSAILVRNCASLSTAALEMDADAAVNGAVQHATHHFVWSFRTCESGVLTDAQAVQYVSEVLDKLGLGHHRQQLVVHRDTMVRDESGTVTVGNLHLHAAIGSVDPRTGMAYETRGIWKHMARTEREVELAHGLEHDNGLYVVRDPGTRRARVEEATPDELAAWRRERREERLVAMERRSAEGYRARDTTFDRYADATVAPRLRTAMTLARDQDREPDWATLHAVAARYGCELQQDGDGRVILRDVGVGELRLEHERGRREVRTAMAAAGAERDEIDAAIAASKSGHEKVEAVERDRKREHGESLLLDDVLDDDCADMPAFQREDEAERAVVALVEHRPEVVLRDITAQSSTFGRDDVDAWLVLRIADPAQIERLGDLVVGHESVRVLEVDSRYPLLTTTEILDVEGRLDADARELAARASGFSSADIDAAVATYEAAMSESGGKPFCLSQEQRDALHSLERGGLVAIEGLPGTGKTTIQAAVRVLAQSQGREREIVGLTLSQAAAERLESEAGFSCVNTSRARIMEESGAPVIPRKGIVVVDEAAMVDSRAMGRILSLARERGSMVIAIGDTRQLQPIDAGASFRIVREAAKGAGTYSELRDIQRQRRDWHREAVSTLADAIVEGDNAKRLALVKGALEKLEANGAIAWSASRDSALDEAVTLTRSYRAAGFSDTLLLAGDKDTVRHLSEEDRRRDGREGRGRSYRTDGGMRELTVGDRFIFLENSLSGKRALGVRNGDRGDVVAVTASRISVRLDRDDGRVVTFSPRSYRAWDHGNALTVHKAQGASVGATVAALDRSTSAELAFVAASRSKHALALVIPRTAFRDLDDLAKHVSERISLKTTSQTYDEILERTGGKETIRVRKIERQRDAESSPLRRTWQAEVVEPMRAERDRRVLAVRSVYDARKKEIALSHAPLGERLDLGRTALCEFRSAVQDVHRSTKAPTYAAWLREREAEDQRLRYLHRSHEAKNEHSLTSGRGSAIRSTHKRKLTHEVSHDHHGHNR